MKQPVRFDRLRKMSALILPSDHPAGRPAGSDCIGFGLLKVLTSGRRKAYHYAFLKDWVAMAVLSLHLKFGLVGDFKLSQIKRIFPPAGNKVDRAAALVYQSGN